MGRVWRATDVVLHREVAIKELVPPPGLTAEERREMRERSLREARAIARLNNINVVRVFDVLRTDADPWIVMEYVPSRSLQDILAADGPFNPVRAAEIGLGVLNALRAAHRAGVVHRDVKPGNVLIGEDGRVVLTDFGLATVPGDPNVTRTGLVLGSPAYIAPERARDGAAGPGADLWSLGATLYAAVEGASPFARPSAIATLAALATENPPPARNAGPLKPVLNGLLRKDPAHRINAEEAERLLLRATGRRSRLSFPMSPTMRRPGAGRERPAPTLAPPVVPGVSASAPVVPGPRPPVSPAGGGRPPIFTPGKASVGGTPARAEAPKPPALDATRIENLDRSRTGAASSPPTPASKSAAHGTAPDATMRGSGSAPGSFTADEVAVARKGSTGRTGAPAAATPPEPQQPAPPAPRASSAAPTVADRPAATSSATTAAAPGDPVVSDAAGSAPAASGSAAVEAVTAAAAADAATSVETPGATSVETPNTTSVDTPDVTAPETPDATAPETPDVTAPETPDATAPETTGTDEPETAVADPADGGSGTAEPKKSRQPFGPRPSEARTAEPAVAAPADEATTKTDAEPQVEEVPAEDAGAATTPVEGAASPDPAATEPEPEQAKEAEAAKAPAKTAPATKSSRKRGRTAKASAAAPADDSGTVADQPAPAETADEAGTAVPAPPTAENAESGDATPDQDGSTPDQDGSTPDQDADGSAPEGGTDAAKPDEAKPGDARGGAAGPDRTRIIKPVTDPDAPKPRSGTAKRPQKTAAERKSALAATRVGAVPAVTPAPAAAGTPSGAADPVPGIPGFGQPSRPAWQPMNFRAPSAGPRGITVFGTTLTRRQTVIAIGLLAAVLLTLVVLVPRAFGGDDGERAKDQGRKPGAVPAASATKPTTAATSAAPAAPAATTGQPSSAPPSSPAAPAPGDVTIPKGWYRYSDSTGFSVPVPEGVTIDRRGSEVYFRKDNRLLIIDQTDQPQPDPVADWKGQEQDRRGRSYRNYERIRIEPVDYFVKAADWEFTYTTSSGNAQRAVKRGVITKAGKQAYGISWYTSPGDWEAGLKDLQLIYQGFKPKS
ncbi:hypothetical protein Adi01nite_38780 [Amorphoplanes digitatis]|nr:hypothetical protein Adi01nite_38780 [Actinoplanes digitatis]